METLDAPQDAGLEYSLNFVKTALKRDWSIESKKQGAKRNWRSNGLNQPFFSGQYQDHVHPGSIYTPAVLTYYIRKTRR